MKYIFTLLLLLNTGCASASHIELGSFDIKIDSDKSRVKVLDNEAIYLTISNFSTLAEIWRLPVIFSDDSQYIDSVVEEEHLFTVEDYINCSFLNRCENTYLKENKSLFSTEVFKSSKVIDVCSSNTLKCLVIPSKVPGYQNEVLVYSPNIKAHYLRVLTKSTDVEGLQNFLKHISLKGI